MGLLRMYSRRVGSGWSVARLPTVGRLLGLRAQALRLPARTRCADASAATDKEHVIAAKLARLLDDMEAAADGVLSAAPVPGVLTVGYCTRTAEVDVHRTNRAAAGGM
jgi:hypothetical protein